MCHPAFEPPVGHPPTPQHWNGSSGSSGPSFGLQDAHASSYFFFMFWHLYG